jgi:hypothetical protein
MKTITHVAHDTAARCSHTEAQPASSDGEKVNDGQGAFTASLASPEVVSEQPSLRPTLLESFRYWAKSRS